MGLGHNAGELCVLLQVQEQQHHTESTDQSTVCSFAGFVVVLFLLVLKAEQVQASNSKAFVQNSAQVHQ